MHRKSMKRKKTNLDIFNDEAVSGVVFKNRSLKKFIISHINQSGNSTITDLSKDLGTSVPKTTSLINELIQDGLIQDEGKLDSTGGRRASMFGLVPDACYFLGVDVKKFHINFGLMDFTKKMIYQKEKVPFRLENTPESLENLIQLIKAFLGEGPSSKAQILGIGINLTGRINHKTGHSFSFFHFKEEPLAEIIQNEIGIPTFLENDSRAMAYGEFQSNELKKENNILFINMDYGMGMGILLDGKVYYGKSGFSGEFGHIPLFENEIICHCGKKGCLETEASGHALVRKFKEQIKKGFTSIALKKNMSIADITMNDIIIAAMNEDQLSIELISEIGEKLGKGLAVLVNIFNPEILILGGALSETGDYIRLPARSTLNKLSLSLVNNDTKLKISQLGEKAGVIGACLTARDTIIL